MATGSGLSTQLMAAEESTVGTAVTVTRGFEVDNLHPTHQKLTKVSMGLRAGGRGHRERNRVIVGKDVDLKTSKAVFSKSDGLWFKHALGATTTLQIASSPTWRQIHTPADMTGKGLTLQGGFAESYSGTVRPYTYNGCKIKDWSLDCKADDLLRLNLTFDGWNWTNATALAGSSYPTALEEFHFAEFSATIGGTLAFGSSRTTVSAATALKGLRGVSLKAVNGLRQDRRFAGNAGIKVEQLENDFRSFTGDLDFEFADRTQLADVFDTDTSQTLVFQWVGVTDDGSGNKPTIRVIYPKAKFDLGAPDVGGPDIVDNKVSFTAYEEDAGTYPLIQVEYESQDTAP